MAHIPLTAVVQHCPDLATIVPCTDYEVMDSSTRHYTTPDTLLCGGASCCDQTGNSYQTPDWKGDAWYRFSGAAGTQMRDTPLPDRDLCGADWPGWMSGGHPSSGEGEVSRTVYFQSTADSESFGAETDISVINCGGYFVYHLPDTPACHAGYCGE